MIVRCLRNEPRHIMRKFGYLALVGYQSFQIYWRYSIIRFTKLLAKSLARLQPSVVKFILTSKEGKKYLFYERSQKIFNRWMNVFQISPTSFEPRRCPFLFLIFLVTEKFYSLFDLCLVYPNFWTFLSCSKVMWTHSSSWSFKVHTFVHTEKTDNRRNAANRFDYRNGSVTRCSSLVSSQF